MRLLESDLRILRALLDHGQLSTSQVAREVGRSEGSIRRRMRGHLVAGRYVLDLGRLRVCDQKLYALGVEGLAAMAVERQVGVDLLPVSPRPPRGYSSVLQPHRRLVADIRIAAHVATREPSCPVTLRASFHDGQLSTTPERRKSKSRWDKFLLGWSVDNPLSPGERCSCIPDAMLVLSPVGQPETQISCFIEADRGTEHIAGGPIWKKLVCYFAIWMRQVFREVPERPELRPSGMRVLFVLAERSRWRIKAMRQALGQFIAEASAILGDSAGEKTPLRQFAGVFRFTLDEALLAPDTDFFLSPIWETASGERVPLFRGGTAAIKEAG